MRIFLIKRKDGGVSVMRLPNDEATPDSIIAKWPEKMRDGVESFREIQEEHIPEDRSQREAWSDITDSPGIDIDPAKVIQ